MNQKSIYDLNQIQRYMMQMRPVLSKGALFSDGTKDYRIPPEPKENEKVTIRFRTKRDNVDMVWLCTKEQKTVLIITPWRYSWEEKAFSIILKW